jgi:hypothetical protein
MYHDRMLNQNRVMDTLTRKNNKGEFAVADEEIQKTYGSDRQTLVNRARIEKATYMDRMRGFFHQNPNATEKEAEEFREKLVAPSIEEQVRNALRPPS